MKPEYLVQHEDSQENIKTTIKFTGEFNKEEIQNAILLCVSKMVDGDEVEYSKKDHSKKYAGNITMMILRKKDGNVRRMIQRGAGLGHYVAFHYFKK
jgi:hypothetical protein